jgi:hypothetical protein
MKGPCRELLPSFPQELSVAVPEGATPAAVTLLSSGTKAKFSFQGGILKLSIPPFIDHEAVAIDLTRKGADK